MFPTLADCLSYIKGLRPLGLVGGVFGSFGWGGGATKTLVTTLEQMHVELVAEPVNVQYKPASDDLKRCYDLGVKVAERIAK